MISKIKGKRNRTHHEENKPMDIGLFLSLWR